MTGPGFTPAEQRAFDELLTADDVEGELQRIQRRPANFAELLEDIEARGSSRAVDNRNKE